MRSCDMLRFMRFMRETVRTHKCVSSIVLPYSDSLKIWIGKIHYNRQEHIVHGNKEHDANKLYNCKDGNYQDSSITGKGDIKQQQRVERERERHTNNEYISRVISNFCKKSIKDLSKNMEKSIFICTTEEKNFRS
ncbi:hypothetical protein ACS0PU_006620 [Formica fusca]